MVSGDALPSVGPETSLRDALDRFHRSGLDGLPVLEAGALTGIVTRRAVAKAIAEAAAAIACGPEAPQPRERGLGC